MGYDLNRFVKDVDEELRCPICAMVLENGVQSLKCEHTYCDACIKEWLTVNNICPIDRRELCLVDIKPIPRALKNLILKLEIKCDFESYGCHEILKLENYQSHTGVCVFDPNIKITCDKDCRLEITQNEYDVHNCVAKLSSLVLTQQNQINALQSDIIELKAKMNHWISPNGLIVYSNAIKCCKQYATVNEYENFFYGNQFAQNKYPLSKINPRVVIEINELGCKNANFGIMLTKSYNVDVNHFETNTIEYLGVSSKGFVFKKMRNSNEAIIKTATKWEKGDVIAVGIEIKGQECAQNNEISIYFKQNTELIYEENLDTNDYRLYPTIFTNSIGAKVIV